MTDKSERQTSKAQVYRIPVRRITANTNPRNPLGEELQKAGWTVFGPAPDGNSLTLWERGISDNPEIRKQFVDLMSMDEEFTGWTSTFISQGQLQAAEVREGGTGTYTLVYGCRRALAVLYNWCLTGKPTEPILEAKLAKGNNASLLARAVVENRRKAPSLLEEAVAIQRAINLGQTEEEVATEYGYSGQTIKNRLALLELDPKVQQKIREGSLSATRALQVTGKETGNSSTPTTTGKEGSTTPTGSGDGSPDHTGNSSVDPKSNPKMRSRKTIEEALKEFSEESTVGKVIMWVLGRRETIK